MSIKKKIEHLIITSIIPSEKARMSTYKKIIFNAKDVFEHLRELKAEKNGKSFWWKDVIVIDWVQRKGNNNMSWSNINYVNRHGVSGQLKLRISNEMHSGQIMPECVEDLADLPVVKGREPTTRPYDPTIQIQKYTKMVKTKEDGITIETDENDKPIYPSDEFLSNYYGVTELLHEIVNTELSVKIRFGNKLLAALSTAVDEESDIQQAYENFNTTNARKKFDMLISVDTIMTECKQILTSDKNIIIVTNKRFAPLVQTTISESATKNKGMPLPNPMTRMAMRFDKITKLPVPPLKFYDKSQEFVTDDGKKQYECAKIDGIPITSKNVHKFITGRSRIDGIVNLGSLCYGNSISVPSKPEILVVTKYVNQSLGYDDVYEDEEQSSAAPAPPTNFINLNLSDNA